jgi:hypothetical protein
VIGQPEEVLRSTLKLPSFRERTGTHGIRRKPNRKVGACQVGQRTTDVGQGYQGLPQLLASLAAQVVAGTNGGADSP